MVSAADNFIGLAEDATQDGKGEKTMEMLRQVRHLLACGDLDIPLQAAIQAQTKRYGHGMGEYCRSVFEALEQKG